MQFQRLTRRRCQLEKFLHQRTTSFSRGKSSEFDAMHSVGLEFPDWFSLLLFSVRDAGNSIRWNNLKLLKKYVYNKISNSWKRSRGVMMQLRINQRSFFVILRIKRRVWWIRQVSRDGLRLRQNEVSFDICRNFLNRIYFRELRRMLLALINVDRFDLNVIQSQITDGEESKPTRRRKVVMIEYSWHATKKN